MRLKTLLLVFFFWTSLSVSANTFTSTEISGLKMQYITYNVWSDDYTLKVAVSEKATTLTSLARDYNGISGINGAFFCPADYSACWGVSHTINERFVNGEDLSFYTDTGDRAIFWWDSDGVPLLHQTGKINPDDREGIYEWLWNFPILFADGKNMVEIYHDNWLYDNKMKAALPRNFICSNKEKDWIIFGRTHSTSLDSLAPVLFELWCWDALNLDAGNSSKFIYNWRDLISSGRDILDGVVVEHKDINVREIESNIDHIMTILTPQFKKLRKSKALTQLDTIMKRISYLRNEIYDTHSQDIFDSSGINIGYTLDVKDAKSLKQVYNLNILEKKINHLIWVIKNDL